MSLYRQINDLIITVLDYQITLHTYIHTTTAYSALKKKKKFVSLGYFVIVNGPFSHLCITLKPSFFQIRNVKVIIRI